MVAGVLGLADGVGVGSASASTLLQARPFGVAEVDGLTVVLAFGVVLGFGVVDGFGVGVGDGGVVGAYAPGWLP